jgi:guanyl-specific ribonuclease Sa
MVTMVRSNQRRWSLQRVAVVLAIAVAGYLLSRDRGQVGPPIEKPAAAPEAVEIRDVEIRDLEGRIVYEGTVDVEPTLKRIAQGRRLDFRNDGSTFQNRERRLPRKPADYYREWVHPTPGVSGPGPQRIVTGKQGEAYYTPDHYRTFKRLP